MNPHPHTDDLTSPRRQKHNQQTRRKPRRRRPRLENSPKPTRNPLPQPTKPNPLKTHEPTPSHRRFDKPSRPGAIVARVAIPRLRDHHRPLTCRGRCCSPCSRPRGACYPGSENETGLAHCPSGNFFANAVWLACATLSHNLYRWIEHHTPRTHTGTAHQRTYRPNPSVHPARKNREPRPPLPPAAAHPMAMG